MKSKNYKKLNSYLAASGTLVLSNVVFGQNIMYTDVNPDVVLDKNSGPFALDFNNDTGPDMTFEVAYFSGSGSSTYSGIPFTFVYNGSQAGVQPGPLGGVQGQVIGSSSTFGVSALNTGDAISAANNFSSQSAALGVKGQVSIPAFSFNYNFNQGDFLGVSEKFMGMKFSGGGNIYYGWVRLSLDTLDPAGLKLTIHDYAYNADPDQPINAGDMPGASIIAQAAIEEKVNFKITPDFVSINITPDLIGGELRLVKLDGNIISSINLTDIHHTINLEEYHTGVYFIEAIFNDVVLTKKIYVK